MPTFSHDGLTFNYRETGNGLPFVFQHGLGGDVNQPFGLFHPPSGFRLLAFDCRGHGETRPLGNANKINLASFADDLDVFLQRLGTEQAIIGGISMGAAVALNFTLRFPDRVMGMVLSRPAWLDRPLPPNVAIYHQIARLIRDYGAVHGLDLFMHSEDYVRIRHQSPDAGNSLVAQFQHPRAEEAVVRLERIPADAPVCDLRRLRDITVPTLVLANRQDPIHPYEYGEVLAKTIPGATFRELTPKSLSVEQHARDVQTYLTDFLTDHWEQ